MSPADSNLLPLSELLADFLKDAREHAPRFALLAALVLERPRLQGALASLLAERLASAPLAPSSLALAKLTVETLRDACDELYRPDHLYDDPELLLRRRFTPGQPPPYPQVRFWVAARLHWFAGASLDVTAEHLQVSRDTVKRLLAEAGPAIDGLWLARYAPDFR